jgi:hypothetical protein
MAGSTLPYPCGVSLLGVLGRLPERLHLRGERGDLRVREAERRARRLRGLRGERLDPTEHHALAIGRRRGERFGGCLGGAGERFDVHHLGAEISSAVPAWKLRFLGSLDTLGWVLRCLRIVAPWLVGGSNTGGPLCLSCLAPWLRCLVPMGTLSSIAQVR